MSVFKNFALTTCLLATTSSLPIFAQTDHLLNLVEYEKEISKYETKLPEYEEKLLNFKIDMTVLKNGAQGGPGGPPKGAGGPPTGSPTSGAGGPPTGASSTTQTSAPDLSPGYNPAGLELKKQYRTAFPQKGHVGPFTKVHGNQTLLLTTYETYMGTPGNEVLIDTGVHVGLGKPLSTKSNACDANKLGSRTTFFLFGKNGILGVIFWSKSLYNEPNNFDIIMNTGVYANWEAAQSTKVMIDCKANEDQWIFTGKVRLIDGS